MKGLPSNTMTINPVFSWQLKVKKRKNIVFSLVSRSNQDGISKSNTAFLLPEAIVTDMNSKKPKK